MSKVCREHRNKLEPDKKKKNTLLDYFSHSLLQKKFHFNIRPAGTGGDSLHRWRSQRVNPTSCQTKIYCWRRTRTRSVGSKTLPLFCRGIEGASQRSVPWKITGWRLKWAADTSVTPFLDKLVFMFNMVRYQFYYQGWSVSLLSARGDGTCC